MIDLTISEKLMRQMVEVCPFRVGHRVKIAPGYKYAQDWPGEYVVVSLTWEYWRGDGHEINVGIASDEDIVNRYGWTDSFTIADLTPASPI